MLRKGIRCARYTAHRGEVKNAYKNLVGKPKGKRALGDAEVDGSIALTFILKQNILGRYSKPASLLGPQILC